MLKGPPIRSSSRGGRRYSYIQMTKCSGQLARQSHLSQWIVNVIVTAYKHSIQDVQRLNRVTAHEVRALAQSLYNVSSVARRPMALQRHRCWTFFERHVLPAGRDLQFSASSSGPKGHQALVQDCSNSGGVKSVLVFVYMLAIGPMLICLETNWEYDDF